MAARDDSAIEAIRPIFMNNLRFIRLVPESRGENLTRMSEYLL